MAHPTEEAVMDLGALEITEDEIEEQVEQYAHLIAEERTEEDAAILAAYRAAKRGLPVIRLSRAFEIAGRFDGDNGKDQAGLPRLAIVRADATKVFVSDDGWSSGR